MSKKFVIIILALLVLSVVPMVSAQDDSNYTIAFVPGVNPDPFYITMASGVNQAASDLGVTIIQQDPEQFDVTVSAPIIEALIARGDIDALVTAPNDRAQSIPVLQEGLRCGYPRHHSRYLHRRWQLCRRRSHLPAELHRLGQTQGGYIACAALADALGEGAKIYIQNVRPGISTTDQREDGCEAAAADRGLEVVRVDYNENSADNGAGSRRPPSCKRTLTSPACSRPTRLVRWALARPSRTPGLQGAVQVALFDASEENIGYLRDGTVSLVIAQKPSDMGYLGVALATAYLDGFQSLPKRVPTGYFVFTADNVDDPDNARFIYSSDGAEAQLPAWTAASIWRSSPASTPIPSTSPCLGASMRQLRASASPLSSKTRSSST